VVLAQARRSSPSEWPSRLGASFLSERDPNSGQVKKSGRTLAQAKLSRLDESVSRSREINSPRQDFAQEQGWVF